MVSVLVKVEFAQFISSQIKITVAYNTIVISLPSFRTLMNPFGLAYGILTDNNLRKQ
jgi:hypothetical protein